LWAWYFAWTAADLATTLYLARVLGPGAELNCFIRMLAPHIGFDAAAVVTAVMSTLLVYLLSLHPLTDVIATSIAAVRHIAPANNLLVIWMGEGFVDAVVAATGLPVYPAYILFSYAVMAPPIICVYLKRKKAGLIPARPLHALLRRGGGRP